MIIKRKYTYYGQLKEDKKSYDAMVNAITHSERKTYRDGNNIKSIESWDVGEIAL